MLAKLIWPLQQQPSACLEAEKYIKMCCYQMCAVDSIQVKPVTEVVFTSSDFSSSAFHPYMVLVNLLDFCTCEICLALFDHRM